MKRREPVLISRLARRYCARYGGEVDAADFDVSGLWNARRHRRGGRSPWAFFSYPKAAADGQRLPRDGESVRFLAALHNAGVQVGIWADPLFPSDYSFACPSSDMQRLHDAIAELERRGDFPKGFCFDRSVYLYSLSPAELSSRKGSHRLQPMSLTRRDVFCLLVALVMILCANLPGRGGKGDLMAGFPMTFATWTSLGERTFDVPAFVLNALLGGVLIAVLALPFSRRCRVSVGGSVYGLRDLRNRREPGK